jgi:5-methylcytosine-specific restriction protein A
MAWSKESRQSRGYGAAWDKLRLVVLERDCGICRPCAKKGQIHAGNQVDHIVSKAKAKKLGWTDAQIDALSNLQTICTAAHKIKTEEEQGKRVKPQIGLDGWPIA